MILLLAVKDLEFLSQTDRKTETDRNRDTETDRQESRKRKGPTLIDAHRDRE